jgi:hypothetical protein
MQYFLLVMYKQAHLLILARGVTHLQQFTLANKLQPCGSNTTGVVIVCHYRESTLGYTYFLLK